MPKLSSNPSRLNIALIATLASTGCDALAQGRVIASVPSSEAATSGVLAVSGGKDLLGGASVVAARTRPARVSLFRGGEMLVCQTSVAHLTAGLPQLVGKYEPILISLDRGALELRMPMSRDDALITPDLRFTSLASREKPSPLDLAVRVAPDGDTCVENRGKKAPTLNITDAFGKSTYQVKAGQHVLFVHGSLREVVDRESYSCGCPPPDQQGVSLAESAVRAGSKGPPTPAQAAKAHPFPTAASEGLASPSPLPAEKPGETHVQVAGTLSYDPADPAPAAPTQDAPAPPTQGSPRPVASRPSPDDGTQKTGIFHSIGRFFKRIFAR